MIIDYAFPASIILLKFIFKTVIGQTITRYELAKTAMVFPVDIAFLGFSFGSAVLYSNQNQGSVSSFAKLVLMFAILCIAGAAAIMAMCKKSDEYFTKGLRTKAFWTSVSCYAASVTCVVISMYMGNWI